MALETFIVDALRGVPAPFAVLLVSMMPILELRGAIPVALGVYHLPFWTSVLLSIAGNMIPAIAILYGWSALVKAAETHWPAFHQFMLRYHERIHAKWQASIDRYGPWALALFVAVPLPLSGVWSGALAAWIFGIPKKAAILAIFAGVCVAAAIVSGVTIPSLRIL